MLLTDDSLSLANTALIAYDLNKLLCSFLGVTLTEFLEPRKELTGGSLDLGLAKAGISLSPSKPSCYTFFFYTVDRLSFFGVSKTYLGLADC